MAGFQQHNQNAPAEWGQRNSLLSTPRFHPVSPFEIYSMSYESLRETPGYSRLLQAQTPSSPRRENPQLGARSAVSRDSRAFGYLQPSLGPPYPGSLLALETR